LALSMSKFLTFEATYRASNIWVYSRLYLDISRSFKWKESFIFRYFKVFQVSHIFTCGLSDLLLLAVGSLVILCKNICHTIYFCNSTIIVQVRYIIIETKEATRIGYNGFLFPHSYSGDDLDATHLGLHLRCFCICCWIFFNKLMVHIIMCLIEFSTPLYPRL
jgi:hypothetical protein